MTCEQNNRNPISFIKIYEKHNLNDLKIQINDQVLDPNFQTSKSYDPGNSDGSKYVPLASENKELAAQNNMRGFEEISQTDSHVFSAQ